MPILTLTETRNLLRKIGHRPKKKLGQNFLIDGNIVKKSLRLAEIRRNDIVIEVGPGLGTLTSALLEAGATVFAVEYDPTLARYLKNTLKPAFLDQLNLRLDDAVKCPLGKFHWDRSSNSDPSFKVVANLPYAITTPWLDSLLRRPPAGPNGATSAEGSGRKNRRFHRNQEIQRNIDPFSVSLRTDIKPQDSPTMFLSQTGC